MPARWQAMFAGLMSRIEDRFAWVEPRLRARQLVLGLLADLSRKNCWTIAEPIGDTSPDGLQHLLGRGVALTLRIRSGTDFVKAITWPPRRNRDAGQSRALGCGPLPRDAKYGGVSDGCRLVVRN